MSPRDLAEYPALMDAKAVSKVYGYTVNTVRKMWQERNPKLPVPCVTRPYKVRKEDLLRHFNRMAA